MSKLQTRDFFDRLQSITESFLSRRKKIRRIKKEKQKKKNIVLDWLEAFLWAAGMVLLANQYLVQAYRIPSGSMIDTLNIGDHIFVNKLVYGPELLPGVGRLPSPVVPQRNDIVIFENPEYLSRGVLFDIAKRVIFMLTLSIVDIDRDEHGQPRAHFLIKRAAGAAGDHFIMDRGEMMIRFSGEDRWVSERDFKTAQGWGHRLNRYMHADQYPVLEAAGRAIGWDDLGLPIPGRLLLEAQTVGSLPFPDRAAYERTRLDTLRGAMPQNRHYAMLQARHRLGWYVPEGRIFTLGDNRDNSNDGRHFGPVSLASVLGRAMVVYWPLSRIGQIR
ncbi:MAG: signal peptidase I [Spirochaetes bacterium]|nr:signal peptidase I [Spirochaetota bacterium]